MVPAGTENLVKTPYCRQIRVVGRQIRVLMTAAMLVTMGNFD